MSNEPITVLVQYRAKPGMEDVAKRELTSLVEAAASGPRCLGISLHQSWDDPTRLILYERWEDRAYYTGEHMRTPHLQAFMARAGEFLVGPPEISLWILQSVHGRSGS